MNPHKNHQRRAQLQIGESMMVLLILIILGSIALVFFFNMDKDDHEQRRREYDDLNALETAQIVSSAYELACAKPGVTQSCFDLYKVRAVSEQAKQGGALRTYYEYLYTNSKIVLAQHYPTEEEWVIYWKNATNATRAQTTIPIKMPVIIHDASTDTNGFGILTVQRYFR